MKLFVVALCVAMCSAAPASLDNTYLPPGSSRTAGGNGNFLAAPRGGSASGSAGNRPSGQSGQEIAILKYNNENNGDGSYQYEFETANGIKAQESGQLKNAGSENEINEVQGSYTYTGDDGQQYTITYIANENGFQPQGAHLPTPPPIPEAILKSLEINAAEEARNPQGAGNGQYNQGPAPSKPSSSSHAGYKY